MVNLEDGIKLSSIKRKGVFVKKMDKRIWEAWKQVPGPTSNTIFPHVVWETAEDQGEGPRQMASSAAPSLNAVLDRVRGATERSGRNVQEIRVVAASKTKSVSALRQVYDAGHRFFGENYVQEILQKAPQVS